MALILMCGLAIYWWPRQQSTNIAASAAEVPTSSRPLATLPPTPTAIPAEPRFPSGSRIGSVSIAGLTEAEARRQLRETYAQQLAPLTLSGPAGTTILSAEDIGLALPLEATVAEALRLSEGSDAPVSLPLSPTYDLARLREAVDQQAAALALSPTVGLDKKTWTFVLTPGLALDTDETLARITTALELDPGSRRVVLATIPITSGLTATYDQLYAALEAREKKWGGIIGVAFTDLVTGESLSYHGDTVFSGMSVIKMGILLQSYISRATFTAGQREAIDLMIIKSDNDSSNELLAMIGDGDGLDGAQMMNQTLRDVLGLNYTAQELPFESADYLIKERGLEITRHGREGEPPYTDADEYVRATPNDLVRLVTAIVRCSEGDGPLLEMDETELTAARCAEMLTVLARNEDTNKIVAGVPAGTFVAHKSGWIDDARADAGYVRPAEGNPYAISMWMWDVDYIPTEVSDPFLASVSRLVYTAQHPVLAGK
jgi:beta-lactamase class A